MKLIKQEFIFGEPLPTPECHASTIIVREDGKKLAAWFAGTKEANPDVLIFVSRFDGGIFTNRSDDGENYDSDDDTAYCGDCSNHPCCHFLFSFFSVLFD